VNDFLSYEDTITAIATPPGVGALGVIRVSGKNAIAITSACFSGSDLDKSKGFTLHYGFIIDDQETIDEVLVSVFRSPKSFTGEDIAEISCHGSPYILQRVLNLLISKGARLAKPGEFTQRAFMHGKMDLSQAEAVADLIASNSEASHRMAMQQMKGGFKKRIDALRKSLIDFASLIELELDFGEEDVEFADRSRLKALVLEVMGVVKELIGSFQLGNVFKQGVYTVIAGRPNAGKSTLLNVLLDEDRAIVSDIAGTTRDTIEAMLNIRGLIFRLVDTAGIREATDQIEALGVQKTYESIARSALLVYVYDSSALTASEVQSDLQSLINPEIPCLVLANKTDLLSVGTTLPEGHISISAKSGKTAQIQTLKEALYNAAITGNQADSGIMVSNQRHVEALSAAYTALTKVSQGLDGSLPGDLLSFELRESLYQLGLITGAVSNDDLLENIFRNFCIGK